MLNLLHKKPQLKYLFIVEFADGTVFAQTPEDKSITEPDKRNCYFDVCQLVKEGKVIRRFILKSKDNQLTVDLGTGTFDVNGLPLLLESEKLPCMPEKFDLIYYHQVTRDLNITYEKKTGKELKREQMPEFREYFIGWQCNIKGKNYQQKLGVA